MIFTLPPSFFFFYFFVVVLRRPCVAHGTINFFYCSWDDKFHLLAKSSSSSPSSNVHCSHYQVAQYNPKTPNSILVPTLRNITPLSSVISPMAGVTWGALYLRESGFPSQCATRSHPRTTTSVSPQQGVEEKSFRFRTAEGFNGQQTCMLLSLPCLRGTGILCKTKVFWHGDGLNIFTGEVRKWQANCEYNGGTLKQRWNDKYLCGSLC